MGDMNSNSFGGRLTDPMSRPRNAIIRTQRAQEEGTIRLPVKGKMIEVTGGVGFLVNFLGTVEHLEK